MRAVAVFAVALAAVAFVGARSASAKAPKPADVPTVEEIFQQAKDAIAAQKAGAGAKQDPLKEAIDGYRGGTLQLTDFKLLVDCINDPKAPPEHRNDAASALIERFGKVDLNNPEVRATRRTIALSIIDLMKADKAKDEIGLKAIEQVLYAQSWYRQKMFELKFHANDKPAARTAAWTKMKKFLDKGQD
jgi:hypothetical protein